MRGFGPGLGGEKQAPNGFRFIEKDREGQGKVREDPDLEDQGIEQVEKYRGSEGPFSRGFVEQQGHHPKIEENTKYTHRLMYPWLLQEGSDQEIICPGFHQLGNKGKIEPVGIQFCNGREGVNNKKLGDDAPLYQGGHIILSQFRVFPAVQAVSPMRR